MSQPKYVYVANLGDKNPLENLRLLYVDAAGVYPPLLIYGQECGERITVARVECDRCTMLSVNPETLSDNPFHANVPAWFASSIAGVAEFCGMTCHNFAAALCGMDVRERAEAYASMVAYFGIEEFDSSPETMIPEDVEKLYPEAFAK